MKRNLFKKIIVSGSILSSLIGIGIAVNYAKPAHAQFYPTNGQPYYTQSGISATATSVPLTSFLEPGSNVPYTMAYLNSDIEFATIDPTFPGRTETISFTGITQNSDGTAILTGVTRGLTGSYPYTSSSTLEITHGAQAQVILSDSAQVFSQYLNSSSGYTITYPWIFASTTSLTATSTASTSLTNLGWIQQLIANATSSAQTNFLASNNTWTGTNGFTALSTFSGGAAFTTVQPTVTVVCNTMSSNNAICPKSYIDGLALGSTTLAASNIVSGYVRTASSTQYSAGYSSSTIAYALTSQFASSTASTTSSIIVATSPSTGQIDSSFISTSSVQNISSTTSYTAVGTSTWTKPSWGHHALITIIGGGGNGGSGSATGGGGGGGGGGGSSPLISQMLNLTLLPASTTITVGAATASSSFGSYFISPGGKTGAGGSTGSAGGGGSGGVATGTLYVANSGINGSAGGAGGAGDGLGDSGNGGAGATISVTGASGVTGTNAPTATSSNSLGYQYFGNGGAGQGWNSIGNNGTTYGAGGGGGGGSQSSGGSGGSGAQGIVVITIY